MNPSPSASPSLEALGIGTLASQSRIQDADVAQEVVVLSRNQILIQFDFQALRASREVGQNLLRLLQ